ncbi:ATP-binding cassette sub-family A member 2 isoform X1 [Dendroctonus ponderosae]|uniref:ATP-binding cassette sub-family A member 2 isoform X1 n=1 Tax=Dendroctonus ponderosae TaxID=77166 RepID=UPI002035486C|nr:ATP-binding cassette sub-family A member 2 isoform X1 [Dendroctonus ponderosae]
MNMANIWKYHVKVILWKNCLIRRRHWFLTLCEALVPVLLFLLIAYGRSKITALSKHEVINMTYNDPFLLSYGNPGINLEETQVLYAPSSTYHGDIIHRVQEKFQIINNNIHGFSNADQLLKYYARASNNSVVAIIFNSPPNSSNLEYTIRLHNQYYPWSTNRLYENQFTFMPGVGSSYIWQGFLTIQVALDMSFIEKEAERRGRTVPDIAFQALEFPYPPYKSDTGVTSLLMHYLPLMTLFSFIFVCPAVLKRVVEEKYSGIKELMRMVGMESWIIWFGWFVYSILPMFLSVVLLVQIMKWPLFGADYPVIEYTHSTILFAFLLLYCITITVNSLFISTLFYRPTSATLVGLLFWIMSYFVPKYLMAENSDLPFAHSMLLMLLPNMALHFGYSAISNYEIREIGVQWSNWHEPGGQGVNEITLRNVCFMLILDSIIYLLLALYIDGINPGKFGVPKSFLFPFKGLLSVLSVGRFKSNNVNVQNKLETFHLQEEGRLASGISLINLTKRYGNKTVVQNLSLDIFLNHITVLLGHNGAGKSTTMGMITGMIKKSSGRIVINDTSMKSTGNLAHAIGLCPQHNLFFPDLTVAEHLEFFARLKGRDGSEAKRELNSLLKTLHLTEKRDELAHTLSGGMKRKLCLGMAVIGGSKILVLDEPSSGMDPQSRRDMWDLLLKWRHSKTILITTHFMEEADAIGDYIAIMNEGQLHCFGTPMSLKKKNNHGASLKLLIEENQDIQGIVQRIKNKLGEFISNVECKGPDGNQVQFLLSDGDYGPMFEYLELKKKSLHIENISFANATLEDVFLNSTVSSQEENTNNEFVSAHESIVLTANAQDTANYLLTLKALLFKRYQFISKKMLNVLIPSLIAIGFMLLCILLGQQESNDYAKSGGPPLKASLSTYGKSAVYVSNTGATHTILRMVDFYNELVVEADSDFHLEPNAVSAIEAEGVNNLPYYRRHMIAAAVIGLSGQYFTATALYNNMAIHSSPISISLLTNSLAKVLLGQEYSITTNIHPLLNTNFAVSTEQLSAVQIGLLWLIIMPLGFLFFLGSFIYFPYVELSTNFTQLQFMCGVRPSVYWLITYLCDVVVYVIFAFSMTVISLIWEPFRGTNEFGVLLMILVLYGLAGIPFSYLFGRKKSFSSGYAFFIILGIMLGVLLTSIVFALEESGDTYYVQIGNDLRTIFMLICPQFGLTYSGVAFSQKVISNYNFEHMNTQRLVATCGALNSNACCLGPSPKCDSYKSYLNVLQPFIWLMLLGALFYLLLNIFLDSYWRKKVINTFWNCFRKAPECADYADGMLNDSNSNTNTLRVKKLNKTYSKRPVVRNVSLDLKKGECMGILGVNGAGKTTTFRMLTKEEVMDNGTISINNIDIDSNNYLKNLGYCPQNDALNYTLTGRDILKTIAMLRGISDDAVVKTFLELFGLSDIADIPCEQYSGGNKRKLSFAVAVIGFPDFILLDEPTNGVDPLSRRKFWRLIKNIRNLKQNSFILTSHSMTECEALCNDLKIMKMGTIKKQGTISKLKNEMAGVNVMLKLNLNALGQDCTDGGSPSKEDRSQTLLENPEVTKLKAHLKEMYADGEFRDEHVIFFIIYKGSMHFYIKTADKKWSQLFRQFEELKANSKIVEDFSISEATLEDVFLAVANDSTLDLGT